MKFLRALLIVLLGVGITATGVSAVRSSPSSSLPNEGDVRFKVTCQFDHSAQDDPIVAPGVTGGAAHMHDFTGRIGITASTTTFAQLLAGPSTCNDKDDHAGYWAPALKVNNLKRNPLRMTAYYRRGTKAGTILPYPAGLKIVGGHDMANPAAYPGMTGWQCDGRGEPLPTPAGCRTDLTMRIEFPDCSDGRLDSVDHRSHMAYAQPNAEGVHVCPPTHPIQVPALTLYFHYGNIAKGATVAIAAMGSYFTADIEDGVHADFFQGWTDARQAFLVQSCLNELQRCDSGGGNT